MAWYERSPSFASSAPRTPVSWDYFSTSDDPADAFMDEEILLMTDAEREVFAAQQCELEEQHLAHHYRSRARSEPLDAMSARSEPLDAMSARSESMGAMSARSESMGAMSARSASRVEDRLLLHHYDRARLREALAARHEERLREDLTFRPETNASRGAVSRYLEPRARPRDGAGAPLGPFAPTVNRVPPAARGERLGAYLRTPVHRRLSRGRSSASRRRSPAAARDRPPPAPVPAAFLRRLEADDRRRAANRERVAREAARPLTFRPALAPGTRSRRVSRERTREAHPKRAAAAVESNPTVVAPHINARSREMRRGVADLRLFDLRRQQRLQQLREEREAAQRSAAPFAPAVSAASRRIASALSGDAQESAQEVIQRRAAAKAEAVRVAVEQRRREEEEEMTFRPEIHEAPPYLQAIARELAANKSVAPPHPKQRPSFRFS